VQLTSQQAPERRGLHGMHYSGIERGARNVSFERSRAGFARSMRRCCSYTGDLDFCELKVADGERSKIRRASSLTCSRKFRRRPSLHHCRRL
jgi:hypothetical protein